MNIKKVVKIVLWLALAVALIAGVQWLTFERQPLPAALEALESDTQVIVSREPWLTFIPAQNPTHTGFIFYQGGRISHLGYSNLLRAIAIDGYLVVTPDMPFNIAMFSPNKANAIIAAHPEIEHWVIGGHSAGGTAAVVYTYNHKDLIDGVVIWASYPADSNDISDLAIPVALIYGSREVGVFDEGVAARKHLLPADTMYVKIEGGDHHQFGSYVIRPEDHLATLNPETQQAQIIQATLDVLKIVSQRK